MTNSFLPKDLFELAKELESKNSESANRTILNRFYYSCYLRLKDEFFGKKGLDEPINHHNVFYGVNRRNKRLGAILNNLYVSRLVADYSLNSYEHKKFYRYNDDGHKDYMGVYSVDVNNIEDARMDADEFHTAMDSNNYKKD